MNRMQTTAVQPAITQGLKIPNVHYTQNYSKQKRQNNEVLFRIWKEFPSFHYLKPPITER
jgi:hypothetical protein